MPNITKISHAALVVDDIDDALAFWHEALGIELVEIKDVPSEGARIAFLPVGDGEIELVQPLDQESGLRRFLEKRGPGMHHLCLEVDDIEEMLVKLDNLGVQLINEKPRVQPGGKKYAFIHPKSAQGVLVELYELP